MSPYYIDTRWYNSDTHPCFINFYRYVINDFEKYANRDNQETITVFSVLSDALKQDSYHAILNKNIFAKVYLEFETLEDKVAFILRWS
jgi:hypothetical protein